MASEPLRVSARATPAARPAERRIGFFDTLRMPRRHSLLRTRIVRLLKLVLPAVAAGLVVLLLAWPQLHPIEQRFRLKPVAIGIEDLENLRVVSARLVGTDENDQPYTIVAEQALQQSGNSDVTDLVKPQGDIALNGGAWVTLMADTGRYFKGTERLTLAGHVSLFHDQGYELHTARADVDLGQGNASGDDPVTGQGPDMELEGEGFRLYDKGKRIQVTGQSRLVIRPAAERQ